MNRSSASPAVTLRISAEGMRLDPRVVGRVAEAVVGALSAPDGPASQPPHGAISAAAARPAETAA